MQDKRPAGSRGYPEGSYEAVTVQGLSNVL